MGLTTSSCCQIIRKPEKTTIDKQELLLNYNASIYQIDKILQNIINGTNNSDIIYVLSIYLNGILFYLQKTRDKIELLPDSLLLSNKSIRSLKLILEDLYLDFNEIEMQNETNQILKNSLRYLEKTFQGLISNNFFINLSEFSITSGFFQNDLTIIIDMVSSKLINENEEIEFIIESNIYFIKNFYIFYLDNQYIKYKNCPTCEKTLKVLSKKNNFICNVCNLNIIFDIEKENYYCENNCFYICFNCFNIPITDCLLCNSKLITILNENSFECNICQIKKEESKNYYRCEKIDHEFNCCLECNSKLFKSIKTKIIIENERFWKGDFRPCPIIPKGIKIILN